MPFRCARSARGGIRFAVEVVMRVLESKQLTILTTDQCTARCAHCSMNSSPHRRARLDADRMCAYIDQALEATAVIDE